MVVLFSTFSLYFMSLFQYSTSVGYGIYGIGPCPPVNPMRDFDIKQIYGGKWYLIAHYQEEFILSNDLHCMKMEFVDGNPGRDICGVDKSNNSTVYETGEGYRLVYERMVPDPLEHAVWIDTVLGSPINSVVLNTDYNTYIAWHECTHFPRDNPIVHEQHNYIHSRTPVWEDPKKQFQKALDVYDSHGIDPKVFVWHDQQDCREM